MSIKKEHKLLLKNLSQIRDSIKKKEQLEDVLKKEIYALNRSEATAERKLYSLRDKGILYCEKCDDLYEISDAKLERKEGRIVVGSEWEDIYRSREIYGYGVELSYYCPKCNKYLTGEIRTSG